MSLSHSTTIIKYAGDEDKAERGVVLNLKKLTMEKGR